MSDREDALRTVVDLRRAAEHLRELYVYAQEAEARLKRLINEVCDRVAVEAMQQVGSSVSLRSLRYFPDGVRLSALEAAGISTVADALGASEERLRSIYGIGPTSVASLNYVLQRFTTEHQQDVQLLPDPFRRRASDTDLLRLLETLSEFRHQVAPDLPDFFRTAHQLLTSANEGLATEVASGRSVANKVYRQWMDTYQPLAASIRLLGTDWHGRLQVLDSSIRDEAKVWTAYRTNNAAAVATLESIRPGAAKRPTLPSPPPLPPAGSEQSSGPSPWAPPMAGAANTATADKSWIAERAASAERTRALRDELRRRNAEHRASVQAAKLRNLELNALLRAKEEQLRRAQMAANLEHQRELQRSVERQIAAVDDLINQQSSDDQPLPPLDLAYNDLSLTLLPPESFEVDDRVDIDDDEGDEDEWGTWRDSLFDKDADNDLWRQRLADERMRARARKARAVERLRDAQERYQRALDRREAEDTHRSLAPSLFPTRDPSVFGRLPAEVASQIEQFPLERGPLTATLRRYQEFAAKFICQQERTVLGDEMGLGKTVEVLAAMCHLSAKGRQHFVVVAPNSVLYNWERETKRHTRLQPFVAHGASRDEAVLRWNLTGGVLITTYGTVGTLEASISECDLLAVDECHLVKNPRAMRSRAVNTLGRRARNIVLMSGTALENRLIELGNLLALAQPSLTDLVDYFERNVRPDPVATRNRIAGVYLRRTQRDVLTELPPRMNLTELVEPTSRDWAAYNGSSTDIMTIRKSASLGDGTLDSAKFRRLRELLGEYESAGKKVVVFSYFLSVLENVMALTGSRYYVAGSVSAGDRQVAIDRFIEADGHAVMVCQIESGGLGMNLQAAQVVVLMEPQLKPSTELQAIGRVHRFGQTSAVTVHRIVARDTIENRLVELVKYKQAIFDDYADPSALRDESAMAVDPDMSLEGELRRVMSA